MRLAAFYESINRLLFKPGSPLPLCMFRIAFGLVLLEYCFLIAPELVTCFSDTHGILRLKTLDAIFGIPVIDLFTLLPPGDNWIFAFYAVFAVACLFFTLGIFTRVSSVVVYLGLVSFLHRNIYVHHGGDHLMTLAAFWMMFAPLDAALSLERVLWRKDPVRDCSPWALRAYQFQFILIYWQASLSKMGSPSWADGTAMYYVFRHLEFARFPVPLIPDNIFLQKLASWGTIAVEFTGWTLIWFKETRYWVLGLLLALHIGIEYAMNIPIFEHIMIVSLVMFIPADDCEKLVSRVKTWLKSLRPQWGSIPIVPSQASTSSGHAVTGNLVRRSPNA